jgi:hypothetical protein
MANYKENSEKKMGRKKRATLCRKTGPGPRSRGPFHFLYNLSCPVHRKLGEKFPSQRKFEEKDKRINIVAAGRVFVPCRLGEAL